MIDNFALGLTHALMLLAAWRLLRRPDLDREPSPHDRSFRDPGHKPDA
ncbi:hypothetical protein [uncultured Sphingomonas sp.]